MQIYFKKKEMDKNIELTKRIYDMKDLDGYQIFFDRFLQDKWKRTPDKNINIETFIQKMEESVFFESKLFIGEDKFIPIRYSVNPRKDPTDDYLFEMICNLTGQNYQRLYLLYKEIYGMDFFDKLKLQNK